MANNFIKIIVSFSFCYHLRNKLGKFLLTVKTIHDIKKIPYHMEKSGSV